MKLGWRFYSFLIGVIFVFIPILSCKYKIFALNVHSDIRHEKRGVSIMTFNIDGTDSVKFTNNYKNILLKIINQDKPDILCFQELSFYNYDIIKSKLDSIYGECESLNEDDKLWRFRLYSHFRLRNFNRYKCNGDIITNDLSPDEVKEIELKQKQMNVMSAEFEIDPGHWVTVFSGHLRSSAYSTARRLMDKDANWIEGISLYKRNYEVGKRIRDYEAENVRRYVDEARAEGKPVIVAGDLNDWCGSDCLNTLMGDDLKDAWWEGGNGFGWTYFGWHLRLRLDHILYSDELELVDVKVVDTDLSDHKPLLARFRVK